MTKQRVGNDELDAFTDTQAPVRERDVEMPIGRTHRLIVETPGAMNVLNAAQVPSTHAPALPDRDTRTHRHGGKA